MLSGRLDHSTFTKISNPAASDSNSSYNDKFRNRTKTFRLEEIEFLRIRALLYTAHSIPVLGGGIKPRAKWGSVEGTPNCILKVNCARPDHGKWCQVRLN